MQIRKLRHAVTLARVLNFTRAAHELNVTQSALSRSIQSLEAESGMTIFDRGRGAVTLTHAGREFIRRAEDLLRSEAAFRNFAGDAARGHGGRISLGVTPLAARVLLAPVLARRLGTRNFHAEVTVASTRQLLKMVLQETIDLAVGLGGMPWTDPALATSALTTISLALIVRKDHPLTRLDTISDADFQQYPLVRSAFFTLDDGLPLVLGLMRDEPPAVTIEDFDVLNQLVLMSDALWITAPVAVQDGIAAGRLAALPLSWLGKAEVPLAAYSLASRLASPLMARVLLDLEAGEQAGDAA